MLTKLKEEYKRLLKSEEFLHKGFLCSAFTMCEMKEINSPSFQFDFYNKKEDTITSYLMNEKIEVTPDSKIFKDETTEIEELKLEDIKIDFNKVEKTTNEILNKKQEIPLKITIILQKQKELVWNLIYITQKFNLLNIKIDATNGKILDEKLVPLLSFEKGDYKK